MHRILKKFGTTVFLPTIFSLAATARATDIEFLIYDPNGDFESGGHLESGSAFLSSVYSAALHIGSLLKFDGTLKIALIADVVPGGSASTSNIITGTSTWQNINGKDYVVQPYPDALRVAQGETVSTGTCDAHMEIKFELSKFVYSDFREGIRGTLLHEILHGLGYTSTLDQENNVQFYPPWDEMISEVPSDPGQFEIGGDKLTAVYGRKVRLREWEGRGSAAHIGNSSDTTIHLYGEKTYGYNMFYEIGNVDAGTSATSTAGRYSAPRTVTPIDMALLTDLGYELNPLNATLFHRTDTAWERALNDGFLNVISIPFLQVGDAMYTAHLSWDGESAFMLRGIASDGEIGLIQLTAQAANELDSQAAVFDAAMNMLHIPNLEVYQEGVISNYSADFRLVSGGIPITFELANITELQQSTLPPSISFTQCENLM